MISVRNKVYLKLAKDNIKKNLNIYIPYIISCILSIFLIYTLHALKVNKDIGGVYGGEEIQGMLGFGVIVLMLFVVVFLFYTNSFIVKRRKKEFGIYGILGMEKIHVSKVVGLENLLISVISLAVGLGVGILFNKLAYLLLINMLGGSVKLGFTISWESIKFVLLFFIALFFVIFLNSIRYIHISNPVELLSGGNVGEKEPKSKGLFTILGLISLGAGYYISLTVKNPLSAMIYFFVAVILVIIGTYLLFTTGSITLLKLLKRNKSYYYKPKNFISVSSMIYRMKQNAVGLANIAILSTMVLVVLSTTVSLWVGIDDLVNTRYPKEIVMTSSGDTDIENIIRKDIPSIMSKNNLTMRDEYSYSSAGIPVVIENEKVLLPSDLEKRGTYLSGSDLLLILNLEEYNANNGTNYSLDQEEVIISYNRNKVDLKNIELASKTYKVKEPVEKLNIDDIYAKNVTNTIYMIVKDRQTMEDMVNDMYKVSPKNKTEISFNYLFNTDGSSKENTDMFNEIKSIVKTNNRVANSGALYIESKSNSQDSFKALYGGLLFIGIFLSLQFLMATIVIMYYKQITEGMEDKERYRIMQNVGLDKDMIKQSIKSQVLIVFFLPLLVACIHLAFAFPIIRKLLILLMLQNTTIFIYSCLASIFVFSIVYFIIYRVTSRRYYNIVKA